MRAADMSLAADTNAQWAQEMKEQQRAFRSEIARLRTQAGNELQARLEALRERDASRAEVQRLADALAATVQRRGELEAANDYCQQQRRTLQESATQQVELLQAALADANAAAAKARGWAACWRQAATWEFRRRGEKSAQLRMWAAEAAALLKKLREVQP